MGNVVVKTSEEAEARDRESAEPGEGDSTKSRERGKKGRQKLVEEMTKQELIEKLKDTEQKSQENYDLYMRTYAEMENVKRRGVKEREELAKFANESLIKEILPVIDSLEKALSHVQDGSNSSGLAEGIKLTLNGLMTTLEKAGLEEVEAMGNRSIHTFMRPSPSKRMMPFHRSMSL